MAPPWKLNAAEEIEKDPKLKQEDLDEIKDWIEIQTHLPALAIEDEMILHFLHACFYNVEMTKKTLEYYYTYKVNMPDFFGNWDTDDEMIQETIKDVLITAPLPYATADGYKVIVCKLKDTNVKRFNFSVCIKWILMTSLHAVWRMGIQHGYIIVYDAAGFSFSHCFKCSMTHCKNYIDFGKNAAPIRVVKVVFINTNPVVEKMLTLVKPFLNKDLLNMMSFHTSPDSFFKEMPSNNIPEDYGGTCTPLLTLHEGYMDDVINDKEWLKREETIKSNKTKKGKKEIKIEKSLKALEID